MKRLFLVITLVMVLLSACAGCAGTEKPENIVVELGEEGSTAFFDFEVKNVSACLGYEGRLATAGYHLVLVELEVENTVSYELPMGRYDFRLFWGTEEETSVYPVEQFCAHQLPDEYAVPEGERVAGLLVFQVPEGETHQAPCP